MTGGPLRQAVNAAIKKLEKEKIKGTVYFYKKGECSCCYGPKDRDSLNFVIQGNYSGNMGRYGRPYEENGYTIHFNMEQKKAVAIAEALTDALEGSGWCLTWTGSVTRTMTIEKLYVKPEIK